MKLTATAIAIALLSVVSTSRGAQAPPADEYRQLTTVNPLPVALDPNFEFRKTKLAYVGPVLKARGAAGGLTQQGAVKNPAIGAESAYRLFGAVTALDLRRRYGDYFDFFWRIKRPAAAVTVRLEYRQEKLRAFTQAREVRYENVKGSHRTEFAVLGDDFFSDGRVIAWRCLLIENGKIVAEDRSYLWR
jgi:hypothetical protein